ncbi:MAG: aspartyl protease family protein [Hyphomonadaceae bacterium]|nr:aspartyl protease family protein [Hyphomonadaceae bacterium]
MVLIGLMYPAAEASQKRETQVLELIAERRPMAAVNINGTPTTALIDTGATIALIDHDFMSESDLQSRATQQTLILGIGGQRYYPTATLSKLDVGRESWTDLKVAVNSMNRFPVTQSVLPISLFDEDVVDFDFVNDRVLIYDGRPKRSRSGRRSTVKYTTEQRLIFIDVKINGVKGKALIDTGADVSFANPEFAALSRAALSIEDTQRMRGSDLSNQIASVYTFRKFDFGNNRVEKFKFPVLRTELFDHLGFGDGPMMVIGMDILQNMRLQVDRERQRLTFIVPRSQKRRQRVRPIDHGIAGFDRF